MFVLIELLTHSLGLLLAAFACGIKVVGVVLLHPTGSEGDGAIASAVTGAEAAVMSHVRKVGVRLEKAFFKTLSKYGADFETLDLLKLVAAAVDRPVANSKIRTAVHSILDKAAERCTAVACTLSGGLAVGDRLVCNPGGAVVVVTGIRTPAGVAATSAPAPSTAVVTLAADAACSVGCDVIEPGYVFSTVKEFSSVNRIVAAIQAQVILLAPDSAGKPGKWGSKQTYGMMVSL